MLPKTDQGISTRGVDGDRKHAVREVRLNRTGPAGLQGVRHREGGIASDSPAEARRVVMNPIKSEEASTSEATETDVNAGGGGLFAIRTINMFLTLITFGPTRFNASMTGGGLLFLNFGAPPDGDHHTHRKGLKVVTDQALSRDPSDPRLLPGGADPAGTGRAALRDLSRF